jgi:hypothetical protein
MKKHLYIEQEGVCAIDEDTPLSIDESLMDIHRLVDRANGGIITPDNVEAVDPVNHMKFHGNHRERTGIYLKIKTAIDARRQLMKLLNSSNNRLLAYRRWVDQLDAATVDYLEENSKAVASKLSKHDRMIAKMIENCDVPVAQAALCVRGIGPVTVAYMLAYINIQKAEYVSKMWAYAGLHAPNYDRYKKGETSGGSKTLRTVLYTMADSQIKTRGPYREVYDRVKQKLEVSEKLTTSRNTKGQLVTDIAWKDVKPSHRHGTAIRHMMKHFLADWWFVHRTTEGLDTPQAYPLAKLGHKTWIEPHDRGWIF